MQTSVELALKQPDFSARYKEEADMIIEIENDLKNVPITVELVQYVSKRLGKKKKRVTLDFFSGD